jgi:hypothetical protein
MNNFLYDNEQNSEADRPGTQSSNEPENPQAKYMKMKLLQKL